MAPPSSIRSLALERLPTSANGPLCEFANVRSPPPFALSLSKGLAELVEAIVPHAGFDRLSPNGDNAGLRYLSPNGSLRTLKVINGPNAEAQEQLT
jgi:hypothetical protein